jgi:hypothetical protein
MLVSFQTDYKKRESGKVEPVVSFLEELKNVDEDSEEAKQFVKLMDDFET